MIGRGFDTGRRIRSGKDSNSVLHVVDMSCVFRYCSFLAGGERTGRVVDREIGDQLGASSMPLTEAVAHFKARAEAAEARVDRLDSAARGLCGALSVWRPGQMDKPRDYPDRIKDAWAVLADVLVPENLNEGTKPLVDRLHDAEARVAQLIDRAEIAERRNILHPASTEYIDALEARVAQSEGALREITALHHTEWPFRLHPIAAATLTQEEPDE